ncbi:aryl-alcohol oxidase [Coprinopsis cinerea okayama7|uniref:pyranose dehydrogenase (acceptor) n=2 Tax=Coprinopsis cinerea TaxID=5346 RepID=A8NIE4_COPC7|nr:aryl-alcohol oxidase [Coprinopsis cinerea okayama7\|eukprot:XP_001833981.2 aryl-alcohol oxidase [Coprinopsis cinerea okayama7\
MPTSAGLRLVLSSLLLLPSAFGALLTDPSQLRGDRTYDYVIVGAGNAGNVIAERISAGPHPKSVLVLEAGVSDEGVLAAQVPFLGPTLTPGTFRRTPFDWNYTVAPQEGLDGRTFPFPRGKMLGGCSSVNYMVHHFGSSEDYNKLARDSGDNGWSWSSIKKYIFKHEKIVPPADNSDTDGKFLPQFHGTGGTVSVSLPGNSQSIDAKVIATTDELPEFPFNPDQGHGNGQVLGMGWTQNSIGEGARSSSSTTYLKEALKRPHVDVLINAHVTKLVTTRKKRGRPVFDKVQFASGPGAPVTTVTARREIILSAGAFGTPQILLLSGIGPKTDLDVLGIPTVIHNPSVGQNLSDHVLLPNIFNVRGQDTLDQIIRGDPNVVPGVLDQWTTSRSGPLANGVTNNLGFFRLPANSSIFNSVSDPATGPTASHWEMIVINFYLNPFGPPIPPAGTFMTLISALISPTSRGFVRLASADPFTAPIIDPKFLTTQFDIFALREAVRATKRFVTASVWNDYVISPWGGLAQTSDEGIDAYVRQQSTTVYHPVGTAAISPRGANYGVVDPDLKLKGAEGVRIADASVWPFLPNAHTQGPVYLLAERAADLILGRA